MSTFPHSTYSQHVLQPAYRDAQTYLFEPMLRAHEAHGIMLAEAEIISRKNVQAILNAVDHIRKQGVSAYAYEPGIEDLFFRIEGEIIQQAGPDYGGNLQLARSRNDLGQALFRMAIRQRILTLSAALLKLQRTIYSLAMEHLHTLMPGYTHTQPAQPTTFAHYLAGVLTFLGKDQIRLYQAYENVNESPLGAAAFTGTGLPISRERSAQLLGFNGTIASTHHSIGAGDHLTDTGFAIQSLAIGLSRVTRDLLFLATKEAGALHIDGSFIQISSIMPQKRNPVVLEHLRARLSRVIGAAQTVTMQCHNIPYGDTQDIEDEIMPPLLTSIDTMADCIQLYSAVFSTLTLNEAHLRERAAQGFTTATELADTLVQEVGLPFRLAHKVVATMVQNAVQAGLSSDALTLDHLQQAALYVLDRRLDFSQVQFEQALDPHHFIKIRNGEGGASPEATSNLLMGLSQTLDDDHQYYDKKIQQLAHAETARQQTIARFLVESNIDRIINY